MHHMSGALPGAEERACLPADLDPLFGESVRALNQALSGFLHALRNAQSDGVSLIEMVDVIDDLSWRVDLDARALWELAK